MLHDEKYWTGDDAKVGAHPFEPAEEPAEEPDRKARHTVPLPRRGSDAPAPTDPRCVICGRGSGRAHQGKTLGVPPHKFTNDRAAAMKDARLIPTAANKRAAAKQRVAKKAKLAPPPRTSEPRPIAAYGRISELAHRVDDLRQQLDAAVAELREAIA